jgi:hypothetical protein
MPELSAAEARAQYEATMGPELGALFAELWQENGRLHGLWDEFVVLFGTSERRIDLLNEAAGTLFRKVQDTFFEAVLLGIARITDPPASMNKSNLSIRRLAEAITDPLLRAAVAGKVQQAQQASEFCRGWRNRRIAHNDLELATAATGAVPLPPASRDGVNKALEAIGAVLDEVSMHYSSSTSLFSGGLVIGGATDLLYILRDGVAADAIRRRRIASGEPSDDDLHPQPLP